MKVLDFGQLGILAWLPELMKHRDASDSKRYRMLAKKFIDKYGVDTTGYDVIKGCLTYADTIEQALKLAEDAKKNGVALCPGR